MGSKLLGSEKDTEKLLPANVDKILLKYESILNFSTNLTSVKRTPKTFIRASYTGYNGITCN